MIEAGDLFFAKKAKTAPFQTRVKKPNAVEYGYKGHLMGVAIGYVEPDGDPPDLHIVWQLLADQGFFGVDDICEVFGELAFSTLVAHVRKKYEEAEVKAPTTP